MSGGGNESSSEHGNGDEDGNRDGNEDRIGRVDESQNCAEKRTRVVDAMWETGETWVEKGKNVEKKGLVQTLPTQIM